MREINLTQGKKAFVDDADFDFLNQWKWFAVKNGNTFYAARCIGGACGIKRDTILMHRIIVIPPKSMQIDHINGNGLDNRRSNLRTCTIGENVRNQKKSRNKTGYKGVYIVGGKYIISAIGINGVSKYLGRFKSIEEAARAYDEAAIKYYGKFANLNFKQT